MHQQHFLYFIADSHRHSSGNQRLILVNRDIISRSGSTTPLHPLIYSNTTANVFCYLPSILSACITPHVQGALPSFERGIMLADPSVFPPETMLSLRSKTIFARKFLPVILPAPVLQLLHVRDQRISNCVVVSDPNYATQNEFRIFDPFGRTAYSWLQMMAMSALLHRQPSQHGFI
jgi:hypothetical protein